MAQTRAAPFAPSTTCLGSEPTRSQANITTRLRRHRRLPHSPLPLHRPLHKPMRVSRSTAARPRAPSRTRRRSAATAARALFRPRCAAMQPCAHSAGLALGWTRRSRRLKETTRVPTPRTACARTAERIRSSFASTRKHRRTCAALRRTRRIAARAPSRPSTRLASTSIRRRPFRDPRLLPHPLRLHPLLPLLSAFTTASGAVSLQTA